MDAFTTHFKSIKHYIVEGANKPCAIASFAKLYLLKQESMISKNLQHLDLGKALFEFSFDAQLHSMCNFRTCFVCDLFSWLPVKI